MALLIKTTGLEQYAPGGEARVKLLVIGGPGVGKTRFASYFPRPIWADCEAGLASVADRRVPYASVNNSANMLDLLTFLKFECRMPKDRRTYDTVVIDTLDAYQRKLKAEWMEREGKEAFSGWEAWGFLNQKMGQLLTRLLNLDMNVIVNVHYKDKTTKDDETGRETHELMLQLQGETADTAFNDFDLVGWLGTYWEAEAGERVQKRGITFKPTPDKPFLKDRLHVTPAWLPITFAPSDYEQLFARVAQRVGELAPGDTVGEIPSADPAAEVPGVVKPEAVPSGALPPQKPAEVPLEQMDKPTLAKKCRELGVTTLPDGTPIKGNTLKSELIAALQHRFAQDLANLGKPEPEIGQQPEPELEAMGVKAGKPLPAAVETVAEGTVNTTTGELLDGDEADMQQAAGTVATVLGGQPVEDKDATISVAGTIDHERQKLAAQALLRQQERAATPTATPIEGHACEECSKPLAEENQDYVKLAWIKYRRRLCQEHYIAAKNR